MLGGMSTLSLSAVVEGSRQKVSNVLFNRNVCQFAATPDNRNEEH
jgi:hypothetical protein